MKDLAEIKHFLTIHNYPAFRAGQIMNGIFHEQKSSFSEILTLPSALRETLAKTFSLLSLREIVTQKSLKGDTLKTLFELSDGKRIESVLMSFHDGRNSVCVSSQVGCQMGCKFCATGSTMKFGRNLTYEEIADQVFYMARIAAGQNKRITNVVYMGMGEPFMNYDEVIRSAYFLRDPLALNIGARNITLSTSGISPGIRKLAEEKIQLNLAVSLHSPDQQIREQIMPVAKIYDLDTLMADIRYYLRRTNRRISYEYVMLKGINDSPRDAIKLLNVIKGQLCHINLIPYNAINTGGISGSDRQTIEKFKNLIAKGGVPVTIRVSLGQDIDAACGQLAINSFKP